MSLKKIFASAALLVPLAAMPMLGCTTATAPAAPQTATAPVEPGADITVTRLLADDIFEGYQDGIYKVNIPAEQAGTPEDLEVILFKDSKGPFSRDTGYSGVAPNWIKAYGMDKAGAPVPAPAP